MGQNPCRQMFANSHEAGCQRGVAVGERRGQLVGKEAVALPRQNAAELRFFRRTARAFDFARLLANCSQPGQVVMPMRLRTLNGGAWAIVRPRGEEQTVGLNQTAPHDLAARQHHAKATW